MDSTGGGWPSKYVVKGLWGSQWRRLSRGKNIFCSYRQQTPVTQSKQPCQCTTELPHNQLSYCTIRILKIILLGQFETVTIWSDLLGWHRAVWQVRTTDPKTPAASSLRVHASKQPSASRTMDATFSSQNQHSPIKLHSVRPQNSKLVSLTIFSTWKYVSVLGSLLNIKKPNLVPNWH